MTEHDSVPDEDEWEAEYLLACDELRGLLLGLTGPECVVQIENWEKKHRNRPKIGPFIVNHAQGVQMGLMKNPNPGGNIVVQGDNNTIQQGSQNTASETTQLEGKSKSPAAVDWTGCANLAVSGVSGLLAGWWVLPNSCTLGQTRNVVTGILGTVPK